MTGTVALILGVSAFQALIPGAIIAWIHGKEKTANGTEYATHAICFGIAFAMGTSVMAGLIWWVPITAWMRHGTALGAGYIALAWFAWKSGKRESEGGRLRIEWYDGAVFLIIIAMAMMMIVNIRESSGIAGYRNFSSDQYHWFGYIERFLADPISIYGQFLNPINRSGFFLFAAPYLAFMPKGIEAYQMLILGANIAAQAAWMLAGAYAGYRMLAVPALGLLIMPAMFIFNWTNYYATHAGAIPQNIAMFLFIAGMAWIGEMPAYMAGTYLLIMGLMHLPTLAIFMIIISMHNLTRWPALAREKNMIGIMTIPISIVIMTRYALYALGWLPLRNPTHIAYYAGYMKSLNILNQPYGGEMQKMILYAGIAGIPLIIAYGMIRGERPLAILPAIGLIMTAFFAKTSWLAYHAFYASWEPFRFLVFLYPLLAIVAAGGIAIAIRMIGNMTGEMTKKALIGITIGSLIPVLMLEAANQQSYVNLDMVAGRDGGAENSRKEAIVREFMAIRENADTLEWPVAFLSAGNLNPYAEWILGKRPFYVNYPGCDEYEGCGLLDPISGKVAPIGMIAPMIMVIDRENPPKALPDLDLSFKKEGESKEFSVYYSR